MSTSASESSSSPSPVAPNAPKFGTLVPNRIFVGGISASTSEAELSALFSNYGCVKATKIIADRAGVSKGYGFVTFETEEEARRIQEEAENIVLKDRKLNIAPAIKKQPFARVYNSAQVVPNGTIMYHNGVPYTTMYNNGMAYFTQQDNAYQYAPQSQTAAAAAASYPFVYPTVILPPHYQYHAAGPGVPAHAHYLYTMPPASSTTTSASTPELYHYTTAPTGTSMQQVAYVSSGSTSDYADGARTTEGSEAMKMSKKPGGGNNSSGYGSPRKSYNTLRGTNGGRGNNGMAGGDMGASRTVKQIQGQQPHLVPKTVNGVTVMAYPTPIVVASATPVKDHSSGDHEVVTGDVGMMHQLGAAHPLTPPHTPLGPDDVMRKLQGLTM